jgi:hypothetical protein
MALIQFKEFTDQTITLDGEEYETCTFKGCRLVFAGGSVPMFYDCVFSECDWDLIGPARNTIGFLVALWTSGNRIYVEQIFSTIRSLKDFPDRPIN